jgi:hypothetical protein
MPAEFGSIPHLLTPQVVTKISSFFAAIVTNTNQAMKS